MPKSPFGPARDESLHRAAQRILRILEREEMAKQRRSMHGRTASLRSPHQATLNYQNNPSEQSPESLLFAVGSPVEVDDADFAEPEIQRADTVPMPGPMPIPLPLPPIVIPGSRENEEWAKWVRKLLRRMGRAAPGGGSDCDREWKDARAMCRDELAKPNPSDLITGGYGDIEGCARGLVSERCGGNRINRAMRNAVRRRRFKF